MAKKAPAPLPLYNTSKKGGVKVLHIGEPENESFHNRFKRVLIEYYQKLTTASTGRPSDGLRASSVGSAPSAFTSGGGTGTLQFKEKSEGVEWIIDETFVSGEYASTGTDEQSFKGSAQSPEFYTNVAGQAPSHVASTFRPLQMEYWTLIVKYFFNPAFESPSDELSYQKEKWYSQKRWTAAAAVFLLINWILYLALNAPSTTGSLYAEIVYYGGLTLFTVPLLPMIYANLPASHPVVFHLWFACAVWYCGISEIIQIKQCGFYSGDSGNAKECLGKDFLAMMYYITALPGLMMFVVSHRMVNFVFQVITFVLLIALIIPDQGIFARNIVSFALFSFLIQMVHFGAEITDRRIFLMTSRVKFAYKQLQKAQLAESQASDAKNRFASYIFHEVRVPLNVVKLAFDHVKSRVTDPDVDQEVYAMDAGLNMMEKVLNDALDLNKMDRGHFENANKPFPLQRVMKSALDPIALACAAKGAQLVYNPDPRVDMVFEDMQRHEGLWVVGDELRLRQVLTNLASNAVKFCSDNHGLVEVNTTLVNPLPGGQPRTPEVELPDFWRREMRKMTIRIEFVDNGPGVTAEDLRENRLFRPFVQAAAGKKKTGTGLGLAIVRQIVSLSGGKLGLVSKSSGGANFWVELTYEIASPSELAKVQEEESRKHKPLVAVDTVAQNSAVMMNITMPHKEPTFFPFPSTPPLQSSSDSEKTAVGSGSPYFPPGLIKAESSASAPTIDGSDEEDEGTRKRVSVVKRKPLKPDWKVGEVKEGALQVLVVDDDPLTRRIMMRTLQRSGCDVEAAEDGQHFLDIITAPFSKEYDLITLDNHMPAMTGEEAIKKLRTEKLGIIDYYVVGCTGNAVSTDRTNFLTAGVDDVLPKPLDKRKLGNLLEEAQRRKDERQNATAEDATPTEDTTRQGGSNPEPPKAIDMAQPDEPL